MFLLRIAVLATLLLGTTECVLAAAGCRDGHHCKPHKGSDYPYFKDRSHGYHYRHGNDGLYGFAFSGTAQHCPEGFTVRDGVCISRTIRTSR